MSVSNFEELKYHIGHKIVCVAYGFKTILLNVALECETCGCILLDYDKDTPLETLWEQATTPMWRSKS
jgi:hypothetical protein